MSFWFTWIPLVLWYWGCLWNTLRWWMHLGSLPKIWNPYHHIKFGEIDREEKKRRWVKALTAAEFIFFFYFPSLLLKRSVLHQLTSVSAGILRQEFTDLMVQINATLPDEYKWVTLLEPFAPCAMSKVDDLWSKRLLFRIMYIPWDFHKSAKSKVEDVISIMNEIAYQSIRLTGFFHSGPQLPANKELRGKV